MTSQETLLYDGIRGYFIEVVHDPEKMMSLIVSVADLLSMEWDASTMLYFRSYLQAHAYISLKDVFDRLPFSLASLLLTDGFAVPNEQTRLDLFMSVYEKLEGQGKSEFRVMLLNYIYSANTDPETIWKLVETMEESKILFFTQSHRHPVFALTPRHPLTYGKKIKVGAEAPQLFVIAYSKVKMELRVTVTHDKKATAYVYFSPPLTDKICHFSMVFILDEHPPSSMISPQNDLIRQKNLIVRDGSLDNWGWPDTGIEVGKCYIVLFTFHEFVKI
ncbi:hypothetical protein BKA69DRAFT_1042815 [Paraphysoderma sedebokerense]|nr:hypothetical protein BKA69DRAFT_1042815 [Paraphysoderma sedebokerense]